MSIPAEIAYWARQYGVDPAYALAVASRESSFNPNAHASKTIDGLFQMSGSLRAKYGVPRGSSVQTQVRGFADYTRDLNGQMAGYLGREPSSSELYLGHYWGPARAAGVITGQYAGMPARDVFTARELAANPNLDPDKPVGEIAQTIAGDINHRYARFGGQGGGTEVASAGPDFTGFGSGGEDDEQSRLNDNFARNKAYLRQGAGQDYATKLSPDQEQQFRAWVEEKKVPFNPDASGPSDYDMRGFWQALQNGDDKAKNAVDPNDGKMHYPDYWKTPYHETFSNESQWANPKTAPAWNDKDQLVDPSSGKVLFDDRARPQQDPGSANIANAMPTPDTKDASPDFTSFGTTDPVKSSILEMASKDTDNPLADLGNALGKASGGTSDQARAPTPQVPDPNADYLALAALTKQMQPVGGISAMPGQQTQASPLLPGSAMGKPPGFDPTMFGIPPNQQQA